MSALPLLKDMVRSVAIALGEDLRKEMTFVGGCATGLLLTDEFAKEGVRTTEDVDLIIKAITYVDTEVLKRELRQRGFKDPSAEDEYPICAMKLGQLRVDFMPTDGNALGFGNQWYDDAMKSANDYEIDTGVIIKLVSPTYFLATKLEAYAGRGNGYAAESRDIEDIVVLVDGREEICEEILNANADVRAYIAENISHLLKDRNFGFVVQSQASISGSSERADVIYERLELIKRAGSF